MPVLRAFQGPASLDSVALARVLARRQCRKVQPCLCCRSVTGHHAAAATSQSARPCALCSPKQCARGPPAALRLASRRATRYIACAMGRLNPNSCARTPAERTARQTHPALPRFKSSPPTHTEATIQGGRGPVWCGQRADYPWVKTSSSTIILARTWLVRLDRWMGLRSAVRAPYARPALPGTDSSASTTGLAAVAS